MNCFNIKSGGKTVGWIFMRFVRVLLVLFCEIANELGVMAELRYQKSFESDWLWSCNDSMWTKKTQIFNVRQ